uniref:Putative reverse transcriptase n=1 Tax=Ixodes ricinus TaxID=34613 RepID=A0A6B0VEV3_IXORI
MSRIELTALGRELGYEGVELRNWVRDEMNREDERQVKAKEMIELKIQLKEVENASPTNGASATHGAVLTSPQRWMAAFDEKKDDLDAYLLRFERLALGQLWPRDQWATMLALCLKGEALSVISRLTPLESVDYEGVKKALMRRFRLTAEGFREKFRNAKPESGETGAQFAARLASLFDRWVELAETNKEYDTLRNLVLTEQFIKGCSPKLAIFIKERGSKALGDMADLADRFLEAQGAQSLGFKVEEKEPNPDAPRDVNKKPAGEGRPPLRCFLCNRMGHRAADCREKGPKTPSCWRCGRTGHTANSCQEGSQDGPRGRSQASCCVTAENAQMTDGLVQNGYVNLKNGERLPIVNSIIVAGTKHLTDGVPVQTGKVGKRVVTILRDTGCNTVVVRRSLIADEDLTGTSKAVYLVDGTVRVLPEARLSMRTPFFSGEVTALCMKSPLYDVILGNIPGALAAGEPDLEWDVQAADDRITTEADRKNEVESTMSAAVKTRLQKKSSKTAGSTPLKVPEIQKETVTPEALWAEQRADEGLRSCFLNEGKGNDCQEEETSLRVRYDGGRSGALDRVVSRQPADKVRRATDGGEDQCLQLSNLRRRGTRTAFLFAANGSKRELERRRVWDGP